MFLKINFNDSYILNDLEQVDKPYNQQLETPIFRPHTIAVKLLRDPQVGNFPDPPSSPDLSPIEHV